MMPESQTEDRKRNSKNVGPLASGTFPIRITYRDTDQMGVVYYANYLVFFEIGRTELIRGLGRSYDEMEKSGIYLPVLEAVCRYHAPAHYDDMIEITTRITRWTKAAIDFEYECRSSQDGILLVTGATRHAFTNAQGQVTRAGHLLLGS